MILCVTPNANVERTWLVPGFRLGGVFRTQEVLLLPSGKGLNAARAIRLLGGEPFCAGFVGGFTGRLIEQLAREAGLPARWTWIEPESRLALAIVDPLAPGADATLISEPGPPATREDWRRLKQDVQSSAGEAEVACLSGSLPVDSPLDEFVGLIEQLEGGGIPVWVDTSGAALREAAQNARFTGLKVNNAEAGELLGGLVEELAAAVEALDELQGRGFRWVCITLGSLGAVLRHEGETWFARPPEVEALSSVGSGDAFLGGLLAGLQAGKGAPEALRMAAAAGAANALRLGGGLFRPDDYRRLLPRVGVEQLA